MAAGLLTSSPFAFVAIQPSTISTRASSSRLDRLLAGAEAARGVAGEATARARHAEIERVEEAPVAVLELEAQGTELLEADCPRAAGPGSGAHRT